MGFGFLLYAVYPPLICLEMGKPVPFILTGRGTPELLLGFMPMLAPYLPEWMSAGCGDGFMNPPLLSICESSL